MWTSYQLTPCLGRQEEMEPAHTSLSSLGETRTERRDALVWSQGIRIRHIFPHSMLGGSFRETWEGVKGIRTGMSGLR